MFAKRVELNLERASNRTYDVYTALAAKHQNASVILRTEVTRDIADAILLTNGWIAIALESTFESLGSHVVVDQYFAKQHFASPINATQAMYFYDVTGEVFRTFAKTPRTMEEIDQLVPLFLVSYLPEEEFIYGPACPAARLITAALEQDPVCKGKVNYFLINILCSYTAYMLCEAEYMQPTTVYGILKAIHTSLEIAYPAVCLASRAEREHSLALTATGRAFHSESDM